MCIHKGRVRVLQCAVIDVITSTNISPEVDAGWLATSGSLSSRTSKTLSSTAVPEGQ